MDLSSERIYHFGEKIKENLEEAMKGGDFSLKTVAFRDNPDLYLSVANKSEKR